MFGYSDIIIKKKTKRQKKHQAAYEVMFPFKKKMKSTWLDSLMIFDAYVYSQKKYSSLLIANKNQINEVWSLCVV